RVPAHVVVCSDRLCAGDDSSLRERVKYERTVARVEPYGLTPDSRITLSGLTKFRPALNISHDNVMRLQHNGSRSIRTTARSVSMRVLVCRAAACLIAFISMQLLGPEAIVATARAQSVPKAIQQGGTDNEMRIRRNAWSVAVAGGQLSGTYMTFANELAQ